MTDIYNRAKEVMSPEEIDHHDTDLYLKVTPESKKLIEEYDYCWETFDDSITGEEWYDVPFAYTPGWKSLIGKEL